MKILEDSINNLDAEKNKEIRELQEELENTYKFISQKKEKNNKLSILNDGLNK